MILWFRGLNYYENNLIVETLAGSDVDRENLKVKDSRKNIICLKPSKICMEKFCNKVKVQSITFRYKLIGMAVRDIFL